MMRHFLLLSLIPCWAFAQEPTVPVQKSVHTLVQSTALPGSPYLAFPAVLDLGGEVLVSFKKGRSHAADGDAVLDFLRIEKGTGKVLSHQTLAALKGEIMQMGEWVHFPNGDIASYIDAQQNQGSLRTGLCVVRSVDGGRTFGDVQRVGPIDGVEYGYAFDAITHGQTTWMLAMTFANLKGGKLVHKTKSQPGSVDVIRTDDNGQTWHFVRSITGELGDAPINESAFLRQGDGFIVTARSYDNREWLMRTDMDFKCLAKTDLTAATPAITSHIGRPRLFEKDGGVYLLGRNWVKKGVMELALFQVDPKTLSITRHLVLDNLEKVPVADGYYAQAYWQQRDGRTVWHVITYKRAAAKSPDILCLDFDWAELKS